MSIAPRHTVRRRSIGLHRGLVAVAALSLVAAGLAAPAPARAASLVVTTTADAGAGSLRQALTSAADGDTITFSLPSASTITLISDLPAITADLTITGPGAADLTISGGATRGILVIEATATVTISGLTFAHGLRNPGGAILNRGSLTVTDAVFTDNHTQAIANSEGGAIHSEGVLAVERSTFSGNTVGVNITASAMGVGGAINATGPTSVTTSTFDGNLAYSGGAIASFGGLTVTNSTFHGNTASSGAAAIEAVTLTITNSTIAANIAATFALRIGTTAAIANTSISGTVPFTLSAPSDCYLYDGATITTDDHNLIEDGSCPTGSASRLSGDPLLGALADNGGPTQTMLPGVGSPLIDAGSKSACPSTDQRGESRFATIANPCDIGAVEVPGSTAPDPAPTVTTASVSKYLVSPGVAVDDTATVTVAQAPTRPSGIGPKAIQPPTGTVTFSYCFDATGTPETCKAGTQIGDPIVVSTPDANGTVTATLSGWVPPDGPGTYLLHAAYSGDSAWMASEDDGTNQLLMVVIGRVPMLTVQPASVVAGGSVEACVGFLMAGWDVGFAIYGTSVSTTVEADFEGTACATLVMPADATGTLELHVTGYNELGNPVELTREIVIMPGTDAAPAVLSGGNPGTQGSAAWPWLLLAAAAAASVILVRRRTTGG